ncbi:MAG: hypothetical protein ACLPVO_00425 [Desulfomonilaceae bacterium]
MDENLATPLVPTDKAIAQPSVVTLDRIWLIVVYAFAIVLVGSALALVVSVLFLPPQGEKASPQLLLTVFTAAAGFLGGLFVPSPASNK